MVNQRTVFGVVAACAVVAQLVGCVTVADHRRLEKKIHDLERGSSTGNERQRLADLAARLDSIEGRLDDLTGRIEVVEHRSQEALSEARAARKDAAQPTGVPPTSQQRPDENSAPAGTAPEELAAYRGAWTAWSRGEADACIDQFRNFLQTYPSSAYAENASYWMADCYFKRGDYKTAILRFDDVVARYPKGKRAPDALYRQGEALLRLGPGYGKAAGKAFERVIHEYPDSARATEAKKQLELLGSG